MTSRWLMAVTVAGGIAAGGVGGYLAVRSAAPASRAEAPAADAAPASVSGPAVGEAVVAPGGDTPAAAAAPAPSREAAPAAAPAPSQPPRPRTRPQPRPTPASKPAGAPTVVADNAPAVDGPAVAVPVSAPPPGALPAPPVLSVPTLDPAEVAAYGEDAIVTLEAPPADLVELAANTVIGIRLQTTVSSEVSRVEDEVQARVTRPVEIDGRVVIPTGARLIGYVTEVESGGKVRERARIGVRFTTLEIGDERVPIATETIYRAGESPAGEATAKIGASAVVGSILGGVIGGKRGAAIGGAAGAAGGTAMVMSGSPNPAVLDSGTPLTVRLTDPVTIRVGP